MKTFQLWRKAVGLTAAAGVACAAAPARADTLSGNIFDNKAYSQTSNAAPTTLIGDFFSIEAVFSTPGSFSAASATYPGPGSPQSLSGNGTTEFVYQTTYFPSLTALHAQYPFGTYTVTASGGTAGTQVSSVNYTADAFTQSTPYLTDYSSLNGLNPAAAFTALFPAFTPAAASSEGFTFFNISNATTGASVFGVNFQSPSTTSDIIPANTLLANTTYTYEIDDSDRIDGTDAADNTFTEQGFDVRTDGTFTTGAAPVPVPEPASFALFGISLFGLAALRRQTRGQRAG